MPHSVDIRIVLTTFPDESTGSRIIHDLLRDQLIACGTMLPACRSIYVWDGKLHDSEEIQVLLKTSSACVPELERRLIESHPYDVPEFVVLHPESAPTAYQNWISESCKSESR